MSKIKVGFLGLGNRGRCMLTTIVKCFENVEIVAVCDPYIERAEEGVEIVRVFGKYEPAMTLNSDEVIARDDIDVVMIFTSWEAHVDLAVQAMRAGKKVAMEVGGAYSLHDCNRLIDAYHETGIHVMMLENACYCDTELAVLKMVREGLFGEIVHCEGGYMHDLRDEVAGGNKNKHYRLRNYLNRNCENYPTHEFGPIAKVLNINHGNRILSLSSFASKARGLKEFVNSHAEDYPELVGRDFRQGDIITTVITCADGATVVLNLDTTLPRTYSRKFTVRGTKGSFYEDMNSVYIDEPGAHERDAKSYWDSAKEYVKKYRHPLWDKYEEIARTSGHDGVDFMVLGAFFESVEKGVTPPIDIYDTVTWMAITPLSEKSIALGGAPVDFPDFTGGKWILPREKSDLEFTLDW
ncbi:MAG: Gfo/Idh/MocA family oxidoreductase [Clostridia bacterium]|nr:Gfo/Idh/MocA family oxidoreductase [Clostridia bacterium]